MDDREDPIAQFFPDPESVNLYEVLSIKSDASQDDIKKAYRRLALRCHPDKHSAASEEAKAEASLKFQQVGFAYAVLSDEKRRKRYDLTGKTDEGADFGPGEGSWEDYFEELYDRVSRDKLDELKKEYQGSEEEVADLKKAYTETDGDIEKIMTHIPHSTHDDEARFIVAISDLIKQGELPSLPQWESSTKDEKAKLVRKKQADKEAKEAESLAKELGVWDEFYGSGKPGARKAKSKGKAKQQAGEEEDTSALQALILNKRKNMDSFFDNLAAKYGDAQPAPKTGKKGKKRGKDADEDEEEEVAASPRKKSKKNVPPHPDIDDAEFERIQQRLMDQKAKGAADGGGPARLDSEPLCGSATARLAWRVASQGACCHHLHGMARHLAHKYPVPMPSLAMRGKPKARAGATAATAAMSGLALVAGHRAPSRRTKGLQKLLDMPSDILLEVFQHLEPRDLLRLSRCNKAFRDFLLNGSSMRALWKATRRNVEGLPECPPYMSEYAYANLLFSNHCHECTSYTTASVTFCWGVRFCRTCRPLKVVPEKTQETLLRDVAELTGVEQPVYTWGSEVFLPEVERFRAQWDALEGDAQARKELAERSAKDVTLRGKHTAAYLDWQIAKDRVRKGELNSLRSTRLAGIKDRLRQEGFEADLRLVRDDELAQQPFAKKPTAITDRTWSNIRDDVVKFVEKKKGQDLRRKRTPVIRPRVTMFLELCKEWLKDWDAEDYDPDDLRAIDRMKPADFLLLPEVMVIMDMSETPFSVHPDCFHAVKIGLPPLVALWYEAREQELNAIARNALPELPQDKDPISLAICAFDCVSPACPARFMHYPEVLNHRCAHALKLSTPLWLDSPSCEDIVKTIIREDPEVAHWEPGFVRVNAHVLAHKASAIVRACGLDPNTASPGQMDRCGVDGGDGYEVFDWRRALLHEAGHRHWGNTEPCTWVVLPEETAAHIREYEQSVREDTQAVVSIPYYTCFPFRRGCRSRFFGYGDLALHCHTTHQTDDNTQLTLDKDYKMFIAQWHRSNVLYGMFFRHTKSGDVEVHCKHIYKASNSESDDSSPSTTSGPEDDDVDMDQEDEEGYDLDDIA
ncbi:hypothetical protein BD413DRAFT_675505 [Trametes elegans]|nr:hypothetical protein BD413DRAFT_675505 [Trametes elegans]